MKSWGGEVVQQRVKRTTSGGSRGRRLAAAVAIAAALGLAVAGPAAAHWEPVAPADNAGATFGATWTEPAVAESPDGLATALFFQAAPGAPFGEPGTPYAIRRAPEAPAWSAPAAVTTPAGSVDGFAHPSIAAAGNGDALGVFHFHDPAPKRVTHAISWPAGSASPDAATPVLCTSGPECSPEPPQVTIDGAGNAYAVASSGSDVVLSQRAPNGTWASPQSVATGAGPQVATNAAGDVVVAYTRTDNSNPALPVRHVYAKRKLSTDTGFGPEVQVSGSNTTDANGHAVVIDSGGTATVAYPEDALPPSGSPTPSVPVIQAATWDTSSATPEAGVAISGDPDGQNRFAVAGVDPQGRVTVAWQAFAGHFEVRASEQAGSGWGAPQNVSPAGSDRNATNPKVAVDAAGTATIAYTDAASPQGGDLDVKVSRRATGGTWSAPESLRFVGPGAGPVSGSSARVAAAPAGQADVIFVQALNGANRLFATRFDHTGYARPKGATPLRVALVPGFKPCTAPNETHGPPLAFLSCNPPVQQSSTVTVGTSDANGQTANSVGFVRYEVIPGNPNTPADEADVTMSVYMTDVRNAGDLSDYTGELQAVASSRITDRDGDEPSTLEDTGFGATVPCAATPSSTVGATCSTNTSVDAIVPGSAAEGTRAIWQLGQVQVFDGGTDGDVDTIPNRLFAVQGVFVP